jgi:hypothetical protein
MMRALLWGVALVAMSTGAQAQDTAPAVAPAATPGDPFAAEYGNTLVQEGPNGAQIVTFINEDRTWIQHLPDGSVRRGTYRWQDDHTVCFAQTNPAMPNGEGTGCNEVHSAHQIGERWTQKDSKGQTYTMTIVAGRH